MPGKRHPRWAGVPDKDLKQQVGSMPRVGGRILEVRPTRHAENREYTGGFEKDS